MNSFKDIKNNIANIDFVIFFSFFISMIFELIVWSNLKNHEYVYWFMLIGIILYFSVIVLIYVIFIPKKVNQANPIEHAKSTLIQLTFIKNRQIYSILFIIVLIGCTALIVGMMWSLQSELSIYETEIEDFKKTTFEINKLNTSELREFLKQKYDDYNFNHTSSLISLYEIKFKMFEDNTNDINLKNIQNDVNPLTSDQKYQTLVTQMNYLNHDELEEFTIKEIGNFPHISFSTQELDKMEYALMLVGTFTIIIGITSFISTWSLSFVGTRANFKIARETFTMIQNFPDMETFDKKDYLLIGLYHYNQFLRKVLKLYIKEIDVIKSYIVTLNSKECDVDVNQFVNTLNQTEDALSLTKTLNMKLKENQIIVHSWSLNIIVKNNLHIIIPATISIISGSITIALKILSQYSQ
jgi:hypothetical protein